MAQVGTCATISILDEPWIKDGRSINDNLPGADFVRNFCVDSLIDDETKCWDVPFIQ